MRGGDGGVGAQVVNVGGSFELGEDFGEDFFADGAGARGGRHCRDWEVSRRVGGDLGVEDGVLVEFEVRKSR